MTTIENWVLDRVQVRWETPSPDALWSKVLQASLPLRFRPLYEDDDEQPVAHEQAENRLLIDLSFAQGYATERRLAQLILEKEFEKLSWTLICQRAPEGDPPKVFRELNANVQRIGGLASLIDEGIQLAPTVGIFSINLLVDSQRWMSASLPRDIRTGTEDARILKLGRRVSIQNIDFRIENGSDGIEEVSIGFDPEDLKYRLTIVGRGGLTLANNRMSYVDRVSDLVVRTIFVKREGEDAKSV